MATPQELCHELEQLAPGQPTVEDLMTVIVGRLQQHVVKYHWVGFYMIETSTDPDEVPVLVLGPFVGAETPHKRIPLNQGICGAAASSGNTVVVDDVNSDPRYLACSLKTKSEIVVPIRVHGAVVGELDVDSHEPAAFGAEDRALCEYAASLVAQYLERIS